MAVDREKYMDANEVKRLRTVTEAQAIVDLQKGRIQGVVGWMLVDLALGTGLRVSEVSALTVEDVDLNRGALKVTRLKRKRKRAETLAIGRELVEHLKEYLAWRTGRLDDMEASRRGNLTGAKGALFVGQRGALTSRGLQQIWTSAIRRAGLPEELSVHSARHTLAVYLLKKTGNLRQVQKQLGHASPAVTANMYADISFEDMQSGLNGLYETEGTV
ncbi:MAG: tyrosine-type recombinase/integrase [Phycisphaerales bacterium]|nr:MAG: tyrosine-type recombinase/integrase [Phycisphaerales bacterium]